MKIHYRIKNNEIEIVRCYGTDDRIVIPAEINSIPVVSAAPYAFSAHKDGEEDVEVWEAKMLFRSERNDFLPARKYGRSFFRIR